MASGMCFFKVFFFFCCSLLSFFSSLNRLLSSFSTFHDFPTALTFNPLYLAKGVRCHSSFSSSVYSAQLSLRPRERVQARCFGRREGSNSVPWKRRKGNEEGADLEAVLSSSKASCCLLTPTCFLPILSIHPSIPPLTHWHIQFHLTRSFGEEKSFQRSASRNGGKVKV